MKIAGNISSIPGRTQIVRAAELPSKSVTFTAHQAALVSKDKLIATLTAQHAAELKKLHADHAAALAAASRPPEAHTLSALQGALAKAQADLLDAKMFDVRLSGVPEAVCLIPGTSSREYVSAPSQSASDSEKWAHVAELEKRQGKAVALAWRNKHIPPITLPSSA